MSPRRIAIVSAVDLSPELGDTVLWRAGIERIFCPAPATAFEAITSLGPRLVVVDAADTPAACDLVRKLRSSEPTRSVSIAALSRSTSLEDEAVLRGAGANLVLSGHVDPYLWDGRLEELLSVPKRRDLRVPVLFELWSRFEENPTSIGGWALNVSMNGALIETDELLDVGSKLDLSIELPGEGPSLKALGQVVREAQNADGHYRAGVEFLVLRGDARARLAAFIGEPSQA
jgi:DNA-binding response OmpR family regulator